MKILRKDLTQDPYNHHHSPTPPCNLSEAISLFLPNHTSTLLLSIPFRMTILQSYPPQS